MDRKSRQTIPGDGFEVACTRAGLAATGQRRLIHRVLVESRDHPTAETVYLKVRSRAPRLSLATVYRNLRLFAEAGIIDEVATGSSFARFDGNTRPHHHLICSKCRSVADFYPDAPNAPVPGWETPEGFEVHSMKMNFFGVCAPCSGKRAKRSRRTARTRR